MKAQTNKLYPHTALLLLRDSSLDKNKKDCQKFFTGNQEKYLNHFATNGKMTINTTQDNENVEKQLEEFKKKLDGNTEIKNICLFIDTHNIVVETKEGRPIYTHVKINDKLLEKILSFLKDTKYNIHIQLAACSNSCNIKKQNKPVDIKEILKRLFKGHSGKIIFSTFSNNDQFLCGRYNDNGMYRATLRRNTKKRARSL